MSTNHTPVDDFGNEVPPGPEADESTQARLDAGDERMTRIELELGENTKITKDLAEKVAPVLEFIESISGALKVLEWIGKLAKPMGYIAMAVGAFITLYKSWKTGIPPQPVK